MAISRQEVYLKSLRQRAKRLSTSTAIIDFYEEMLRAARRDVIRAFEAAQPKQPCPKCGATTGCFDGRVAKCCGVTMNCSGFCRCDSGEG